MDTLVSDDIPNIRFNIAKSYGVLIDTLKRLPDTGTVLSNEAEGKELKGSVHGTQLIQQQIVPNLEKLMQDDDVDVRYFASTAAQVYGIGVGGDGDAMQTS
jgi:serine/threonine-protein phosphatase 2A regulatory subunit A